MKYYKMDLSWDSKIKGVEFCKQVELDEILIEDVATYEKVRKLFSWIDYFEKKSFVPDFQVKIEGFKVMKKARLTDILDYTPSYAGCPFMVNEIVIELFRHFNLPEHYYYPLNIVSGENMVGGYSLFQILYSVTEIVDFPKSVFFSGFPGLSSFQYRTFNSREEYWREGGARTTHEKIVLNSNFDTTLDLVQSRVVGLMVSEKLKEAIEKTGLTGFAIRSERPVIEVAG